MWVHFSIFVAAQCPLTQTFCNYIHFQSIKGDKTLIGVSDLGAQWLSLSSHSVPLPGPGPDKHTDTCVPIYLSRSMSGTAVCAGHKAVNKSEKHLLTQCFPVPGEDKHYDITNDTIKEKWEVWWQRHSTTMGVEQNLRGGVRHRSSVQRHATEKKARTGFRRGWLSWLLLSNVS